MQLNSDAKQLRKDKKTLQQVVLDFMRDNHVGDIALNGGYAVIRKQTQKKAPLKLEDLEKGLARRFRITREEAKEIIVQIKGGLQVTSNEVLQLKKPPKKKPKTN